MADIAELGFKVDTRDLRSAAKAQDDLAKSSSRLERAAAKSRKALNVGFAATAAAATAAAVAVAAIYARQSQLIDQNAKLAQTLGTTYTGLANMQRAADLSGVSMGELQQASFQLTRRLSQAAGETGPAADALDRLGLSAEQLSRMPVDQRMATINRAIRDTIPAAEQAAVSAQLFGDRAGLAIQRLSPETIERAAREVEVFGLNLSDVDAAKVEMANDAFSTFGMLTDGIGKQLTVELAPIVKAIADLFFDAAEEAGGMGNVVGEAVESTVRAVGFAVDVVDGLGRVFTLVTSGAAVGIAYVVRGIVDVQKAILELAARVPGMRGIVQGPIGAMEEMSRMAQAVIDANMDKIDDALHKPLRGGMIVEFVAEAREAGQRAAEMEVAARGATSAVGELAEATSAAGAATKASTDEVQKQISALERAAATWGMTSEELALYDLRLNGATGTQLAYARSLLDTVAALDAQAEAQEEASRKQAEIDREAQGIIEQMRTEEQVIADSYARRRDIVLMATMESEEARTALLEQLELDRNERLAAIELERTTKVLEMNEQFFSGMAGLASAFAGEQSDIYRAMFAVEKGFAVARALMNAPTAYTEAYTATVGIPIVGPALAPIAGGVAAAAQVAQAGAIRGVTPSFDGGGHTGHGPRTGGLDGKGGYMAMVHPQERIIDEYRGQSGGGQQVTNNFIMQGRPDNRTQAQISQTTSRAQRIANSRFGQ